MEKSIIYYTDNRLGEPIFSIVQEQIRKAHLPIVSVSLKPIAFGKNFVLDLTPNIITMTKQITKALKESDSDCVFFCEHDVLYPISHFDFGPEKENIFYYNANIWRWSYPKNKAITYDRLICLSGMCANRKYALEHYERRLRKIEELKLKTETKDPLWARLWGFEPGTKKTERGGFSDDDFKTWFSPEPIIDIRHKRTYSPPKTTLESFIHKPQNWKETTLDKIPGWNLAKLFDLGL